MLTLSRIRASILFLALLACLTAAALGAAPERRVLVYTKNQVGKGLYVHDNIPASVAAIKKLGAANNFAVDVSDDPAVVHRPESQALQGPHLRQHQQRNLRQRGTEGRFPALHPCRRRVRGHPFRDRLDAPVALVLVGGRRQVQPPRQDAEVHREGEGPQGRLDRPPARHVRVDGRVLLRGSHARRACTCCWRAT